MLWIGSCVHIDGNRCKSGKAQQTLQLCILIPRLKPHFRILHSRYAKYLIFVSVPDLSIMRIL